MSLHISQRFRAGGASVSVNMHDLTTVKAQISSNGNAWVTFGSNDENHVAFHVPPMLAEMLADAFEEYHNWLSSQEGPAYDDALAAGETLAAVRAARAREDAARALK